MDVANHFGNFARFERMKKGLTLEAMGEILGVTGKRVWDHEQMDSPAMQNRTKLAYAGFWGVSFEQFDATWRQPRPDVRNMKPERAVSINNDARPTSDKRYAKRDESGSFVSHAPAPANGNPTAADAFQVYVKLTGQERAKFNDMAAKLASQRKGDDPKHRRTK